MMISSILAAALAATNGWPFAMLRSYGSYERNRVFTSRAFAAQERHPGLIEEIWFCDDGTDPFMDPDLMGAKVLASCGGARERCEKLGIRFSYQQGVTLGHSPDDRPHPGIPDDAWIVDASGRIRRGMFCCTSDFVRDFAFREVKSIVSALRPDSYWPDDDLRLMKIDFEKPALCFCPRCLDLFGRRIGRKLGREELLRLLNGPGAEAKVRMAWCAFNAEMLDRYAKAYREAVDAVRPQTRLGIQAAVATYSTDGDFAWRVLDTFAGRDGRSGIRVGSAYYTDLCCPSQLTGKMLSIAHFSARLARHPRVGQICYETENNPHMGAKKSPGGMMAECALALACGCDSISFYWGAGCNAEDPASYDFWFDTMAAWRPFHLAVRDAFRGTWQGGCAVFRDGGDAFATDGWYNRDDHGLPKFAFNAIPVTVAEAEPDVFIVDEPVVVTLVATDLPRLFAHPTLMDVAALSALKTKFPGAKFPGKVEIRELGPQPGVATSTRRTGLERFPEFGACDYVAAGILPKDAAVVPYSVMTADTNACGTCVIPTEFGGKAVVVQKIWSDWDWAHTVWAGCRRRGVLNALDEAVPGGMPVRLMTDGYAVTVNFSKTPDGKAAAVFLMNFGTGPTPPLDLVIRKGAAGSWREMLPDGSSRELGSVSASGIEMKVRVRPLPAYGVALIAPGSPIAADRLGRPSD